MTNDTETWTASYEKWRHGGWYVTNVRYPNGAVGCVSNNYADGRWRIVCEDSQTPFPSRDAAARAERVLALYQSRAAAIPNATRNGA
jgi:hypothetical protein